MAKSITTQQQLRDAIANVLADTDFAQMGQLKAHKDKETGAETDQMFLTVTTRMPSDQPVTVGGDDYWPNSFQVKIDAFKLAAEPKSSSTSTRAASVNNAELLRSKLHKPATHSTVPNGGKPVVAAAPAKPAPVKASQV